MQPVYLPYKKVPAGNEYNFVAIYVDIYWYGMGIWFSETRWLYFDWQLLYGFGYVKYLPPLL